MCVEDSSRPGARDEISGIAPGIVAGDGESLHLNHPGEYPTHLMFPLETFMNNDIFSLLCKHNNAKGSSFIKISNGNIK
jgi:hypothetical protein